LPGGRLRLSFERISFKGAPLSPSLPTGSTLPSELPVLTRLPGMARDWGLFLDLDGTLIDIASRPEAVTVAEDLLPSLARLTNLLEGAIAVVTGRKLEDVDNLLGPLSIPIAGLHGAAIRLDGKLLQAEGSTEIPPPLTEALLEFVLQRPGLLIEPKGASIAVHYRNAPDREAEVEAEVIRLVAAHAPLHDIQPGKMVFEIKPRGVNKGLAVQKLLETPCFRGRKPAVFGDDLTDEAGFSVARLVGGAATIIGAPLRPTGADHRLADPSAMRAWLAGAWREEDAPLVGSGREGESRQA
jgi:trehalose 6-phosphate phosphatase